jgi:hypothetical protein
MSAEVMSQESELFFFAFPIFVELHWITKDDHSLVVDTQDVEYQKTVGGDQLMASRVPRVPDAFYLWRKLQQLTVHLLVLPASNPF